MFIDSVKCGIIAGAIGGAVFGLLIALVANPLVGFADEFAHETALSTDSHGDGVPSDHHATGGSESHHQSAVSMTVTNGVSIVSGILWGILLGGVVFGVVYFFLEPRIPGTGGVKSYVLAAAGFITVSGAPWLVLPPQPPGVTQTLTTETRLLLYGGMMVTGAVVCLLAGAVYSRVRGTWGRRPAATLAVLPAGILAIPIVLAPANPVETPLPPELATGLTGLIVFGQLLLWGLLAGVHARLRRQSMRGPDRRTPTARDDPMPLAD